MRRWAVVGILALLGQQPHACTVSQPDEVELAARTARITRGCETVVFTTAYFQGSALLENPSLRLPAGGFGGSTCAILVVNVDSAIAVARHCDVAPWRVVVHGTRGASRRASRLVKVAPHLFFPASRFLIFVDWKLRLMRSPTWILDRTVRRAPGFGFAALRHPCATASGASGKACSRRKPGEFWWETEARIISDMKKTDEPERLGAQVARFAGLGRGRFGDFAEGGLVVWNFDQSSSAERLACAWRAAYSHNASSDRDQLALAEALAEVSAGGEGGLLVAGVLLVDGGDGCALCHWEPHQAASVATVAPKILAYANSRGGVATRNPAAAARASSRCAGDVADHWIHDAAHEVPDQVRSALASRFANSRHGIQHGLAPLLERKPRRR